MKNSGTSSLFSSVVFTILLAGGASLSQAATINVTASATDTLGGNGECSLREAITNINDGANTYGDCTSGSYGSGDTINIPAGTYTTTIAGSGEDLNATGDYDILANVSIVGAGSSTTTIDGNGGTINDRVFHIIGAYTVFISGVTVTGGVATSNPAGGIRNNGGTLTVTNSTITGNSADYDCGGIQNYSGTLTVTNSTITSNTAGGDGAGLHNRGNGTLTVINSTISDNISGEEGGGIDNEDGSLTVTNSTISGNTAHWGGGIDTEPYGASVVTNSTITGNTATDMGGGFLTDNRATLIVTNSTVVRNTAPVGQGGGIQNRETYSPVGTSTFTNSIVANNGAEDCTGTITNSGGNIDSDGSCGTFTQNAAMVQGTGFGALASNGGPTQTHALLQGSAAINAAPTCAALTTDQRGTARPQGGACDIGAYELAVAPAAIPTVNVWAMMIFMFFAGLGSLHYLRRK